MTVFDFTDFGEAPTDCHARPNPHGDPPRPPVPLPADSKSSRPLARRFQVGRGRGLVDFFRTAVQSRRRAHLLKRGLKHAKQMVADPCFSDEDVAAYINFLLEADLGPTPPPPPPPADPLPGRCRDPVRHYLAAFCTVIAPRGNGEGAGASKGHGVVPDADVRMARVVPDADGRMLARDQFSASSLAVNLDDEETNRNSFPDFNGPPSPFVFQPAVGDC